MTSVIEDVAAALWLENQSQQGFRPEQVSSANAEVHRREAIVAIRALPSEITDMLGGE